MIDIGYASIPTITVICFVLAEGLKAKLITNEWIPVACGIMGGILGIVAMFTMPGFPGKDYITSIAIGIVSGLAATGAHQIYKQLG